MDALLSFEIIHQDDHLLEVEVAASNGKYVGVTRVYVSADGTDLVALGQKLMGFPVSIAHEESYELGAIDGCREQHTETPSDAPCVGLVFRCIDGLGHTAVGISLQEGSFNRRKEARGRVYLELLFEPAQVDIFARELLAMGESKHGTAVLRGYKD